MIELAILSAMAASSCPAPIPDAKGWESPPICRHELTREEFNIVCRISKGKIEELNPKLKATDLPCAAQSSLNFIDEEAGTEVQFYTTDHPNVRKYYHLDGPHLR